MVIGGITLGQTLTSNTAISDLKKGIVSSYKKYMSNGFGGGVVGAIVFGVGCYLGAAEVFEKGLAGEIQKLLINGGIGLTQTMILSAINGETVSDGCTASSFALTGISSTKIIPNGLSIPIAILINYLCIDWDNDDEADDKEIGDKLIEFLETLSKKPFAAE